MKPLSERPCSVTVGSCPLTNWCLLQAHREGAPLPHWSPDEAKLFFNAYGKYNSPKGVLWEKVLLPPVPAS